MSDQHPSERDGARVHDIRVADADAYLVEPIGGGRGPGVLFLHWFDTEAPDGNRTQFLDEAVELARDDGFVSILPQGQFPWAGDPTDASSDAQRIRAEVERHRMALDHLAQRADVDASRIGLVGHDFGGMHGVVLAADDPRIAAAVVIAATPRWGDWFLPFWRIDGDRFDYLRALSELDPISRIGDLAPRPLFLQFARNDFFIAAMTGMELHRAAGEPKEMRAYDADHGVRDPQARTDRREFLVRHLAATGSVPVAPVPAAD
ncbi:MAG TPA: alpha/beta fold hydrolase [Candidatus Limnocylindria bacterium]|nr:alpha/beta fold hydrolase [Candidatus Limnocylindria bacterium]